MSYTIKELQSLSDEEIIAAHDAITNGVTIGVSYYLDEIRRRETAAAMKSSQRLAWAATFLGAVGTFAAVASLFLR